jgi:hypothetical protein
MSTRHLLIAFVALFCTSRIAHAQGTVEVYMQAKPADQSDPKQRGKAPRIEATLIGAPKVPLDKFSISTTLKNNQKVTLKADKLREYTEGTETLALALVINGQEIWIGNDDYETDENAKYAGVLKNLEQAIDKLQLGNAGPPGSKGVVVSYSTGADIKVPMGDLKAITGGALGSQKDYNRKLGTDMVSGITMAMTELRNVSTARKVLIVLGDGTDTNPELAKSQLKDMKEQARKQNIQLFGVVYKSALTGDAPVVLTTLIPGVKTVNSIDGIASELGAIIARMADRYYLEFPGYDPKLKQGLPWDNKEHDLVIKIDQTELEPVTMVLSPMWNPPSTGGFPWLVLILVVVGLLLLIIIGVKVFGSKPVEAPAPMPMPMPMMQGAPEPPKPMGPAKTVMIGAGGDQDGFPIVGWIVALNGQDAYRTQRLKPGMTKIGTAPPADIVVNDGFMSTEHCQIACSPAGFTLIDNGATNGCYVNDKKVQKHELVDNDTITLGKTNFKFKSIN